MKKLNKSNMSGINGGSSGPFSHWYCTLGGASFVISIADPRLGGFITAAGSVDRSRCIPLVSQ